MSISPTDEMRTGMRTYYSEHSWSSRDDYYSRHNYKHNDRGLLPRLHNDLKPWHTPKENGSSVSSSLSSQVVLLFGGEKPCDITSR